MPTVESYSSSTCFIVNMIDRDDSKLNTLHPEIDEVNTVFPPKSRSRADVESQLFKKMGGAPRLPIPSVSAVKSFRQSYNKLVSRYNASQLAVSSLPPKPTWTEVDRHVPVRDSTTIAIRAYIPSDADGPLALGIMLHGGGWFMGNLETEQFMCRLLCARLNLVTVNVDFRLYPDVDFPVPITDCYDVVQWLSMHASELDDRIDLTKGFIVGGSSGGGTYASIACHLARDESMKPPLTGCYLACPILGDRVVRESGPIHDTSIFGSDRNKSDEQHANAPITNRETQQAIKGE